MMSKNQTYEQSFIQHPYIMRYFDNYMGKTYYFRVRDKGIFKVVIMHGEKMYYIYRIMASGMPEFVQNLQNPNEVIDFVNKM